MAFPPARSRPWPRQASAAFQRYLNTCATTRRCAATSINQKSPTRHSSCCRICHAASPAKSSTSTAATTLWGCRRQRSRGAGEQRRWEAWRFEFLSFSSAPLLPCPSAPLLSSPCVGRPDVFVKLELKARPQVVFQHPRDHLLRSQLAECGR